VYTQETAELNFADWTSLKRKKTIPAVSFYKLAVVRRLLILFFFLSIECCD